MERNDWMGRSGDPRSERVSADTVQGYDSTSLIGQIK
jgi:hypothetical protein